MVFRCLDDEFDWVYAQDAVLVGEVLSPANTRSKIEEKKSRYAAGGIPGTGKSTSGTIPVVLIPSASMLSQSGDYRSEGAYTTTSRQLHTNQRVELRHRQRDQYRPPVSRSQSPGTSSPYLSPPPAEPDRITRFDGRRPSQPYGSRFTNDAKAMATRLVDRILSIPGAGMFRSAPRTGGPGASAAQTSSQWGAGIWPCKIRRRQLEFEESDRNLRKSVGFTHLLFICISSIIGSGWLFASLGAASVAGPAR